MADIVMAYIATAHIVVGYIVMVYIATAHVVVGYIVMAYTRPSTCNLPPPSHKTMRSPSPGSACHMAYIVMAYTVMAYIVMAYIGMTYIVMAYIVMVYIVMAYIDMAYVVMAPSPGSAGTTWLCGSTTAAPDSTGNSRCHNYIGCSCIGHYDVGHDCVRHNDIGHNYIGHD